MDAERVSRAIEGLRKEAQFLSEQLQFNRSTARPLINELIESIKNEEPIDPWTDRMIARKHDFKFRRSKCVIS